MRSFNIDGKLAWVCLMMFLCFAGCNSCVYIEATHPDAKRITEPLEEGQSW